MIAIPKHDPWLMSGGSVVGGKPCVQLVLPAGDDHLTRHDLATREHRPHHHLINGPSTPRNGSVISLGHEVDGPQSTDA